MPQSIVVKKFGGSMLKTPTDFEKVAKHLADNRIEKQIVILSAPFLKTDNIYKKIKNRFQQRSPQFEALLLSTGEQESLATLGMLLEDQKIKTDYIYGANIPLLTDENYSEAKVTHVAKDFLLEKLKKVDVLLIAGFQGIAQKSQHLTLLGRGGSDLTAIVIAAILKAPCYFFKDSGGIGQSLNQNYLQHYSTLNFEEIVEMADAGSKVIYEKAAFFLANYKVSAFFGSLNNPKQTKILPVKSRRIDNIEQCNSYYKIQMLSKDLRQLKKINQFFNIEIIDNKKEYINLIVQKKHEKDLDRAEHSILECLKVGNFKKISAIRITGCGLLDCTPWYLGKISQHIKHLDSIYSTQFKVIITLDDITGKQVLRVLQALKENLTEFVEQ